MLKAPVPVVTFKSPVEKAEGNFTALVAAAVRSRMAAAPPDKVWVLYRKSAEPPTVVPVPV